MPKSSAVVAGNPALASQYNNLRDDAIALTITVTSGEAFSTRDLLYIKASDSRAYKADADALESGICQTPLFAAGPATGAAQSVSAYIPGGLITGFSGLTVGVPYYPSSTAGAITTTEGTYARIVGYATSSTEFIFSPGKDNTNFITKSVTAGENWAVGNLLYHSRADGRWYKTDADVAVSGICEEPGIAFATQTGGAGTSQVIYLPGSYMLGLYGIGSGERVYPSSTAGAIATGSPPGYDLFYRLLGFAFRASAFSFTPQEMQFLPSGIQEKGYCAASSESVSGGAGREISCGVNFKKIMSNTPSSITFSSISTSGVVSGPFALNMNRFGFGFQITRSSTGAYNWYGTYQTVGN